MQPNRLLRLFTGVQLLLFAALGYTLLTQSWELVSAVVIAGGLCAALFGYWYVAASPDN